MGLTAEELELDAQQQRAVDIALAGKSLALLGGAGTGKSLVLRRIIAALRARHGNDEVCVTAPSGLAASTLGGQTLHAFAGIGLGNAPPAELARRVRGDIRAQKRWRKCKVLVVDEVSQLDGGLLDVLHFVATKARPSRLSGLPLSGIQLVLAGDFAQLRPPARGVALAFESETWARLFGAGEGLVVLERPHRLRGAQDDFRRALEEARGGDLSEWAKRWLRARCVAPPERVPVICGTNAEAERENEAALKELAVATDVREFAARDTGGEPCAISRLTRLRHLLRLFVGARVMLVRNLDTASGLVNGALGVVVRFDEGWPVVRFKTDRVVEPVEEETEVGSREQVPLVLAYGLTIHKAQGMELDAVVVDLRRIFDFGQAYTALSRVTSARGLYIRNFSATAFKSNPKVKRFLRNYRWDGPTRAPPAKRRAPKDVQSRQAPPAARRRFVHEHHFPQPEPHEGQPQAQAEQPEDQPQALDDVRAPAARSTEALRAALAQAGVEDDGMPWVVPETP